MDIGRDPFIGTEALASGALTRYELRRYYRAVMPNVYVDRRIALTLHQRTCAAWLWSQRQAIVAGLAASALHDAKWVGDGAPIELIWANARTPEGVIARADLLLPGESQSRAGLSVTTPERTAFDIGRRGRLNEAVSRLDALANATDFKAVDVLALADWHPHARGLRQLESALDLYDAGAQSPQETWLRLMIVNEGYPRPQTQIPVPGPNGRPRYYLDMGWEEHMLAVEYDGVQHADALGYDIVRNEYISQVGWTTIRVAAGHRRPEIMARLHRAWNRLAPPLTLR
ncbi:endonuclease domain-containing protein [Mycobacterium sp. NPDC003449]